MSCSLICNGFRTPARHGFPAPPAICNALGESTRGASAGRCRGASLEAVFTSRLLNEPANSFLPATHDGWTAADLWVARWGRNAGRFPRLVHGGPAIARSGGYRCSRLSTKSQHRSVIALGGLRHSWRRRAETGLVRRPPAERLIWPPPVVPVEEFSETALLLKPLAAGGIDPFVLHCPPQPLVEDIVVTARVPVHADFDLMIQ
jgi:hypothetical protein